MYGGPWANKFRTRSICGSTVSSTYLLIGGTLGCGRKLTGGQIVFLASSNGVGLASFEDGVACVRVGLDLVRGRRQQGAWASPDLTKVSGATSMVGKLELHGYELRRHMAFLDLGLGNVEVERERRKQ